MHIRITKVFHVCAEGAQKVLDTVSEHINDEQDKLKQALAHALIDLFKEAVAAPAAAPEKPEKCAAESNPRPACRCKGHCCREPRPKA